MYIQNTIKKYLDDLAAKLSTPGGGSVAALIGALGTGLLSMVCNFTIGKQRYQDVETTIKDILSQSERARFRLMELVDLDVEAYKSKDLQNSLYVPLEVCRISHELAKACTVLAEKGNVNLISDIGCAYDCFLASFNSARRNVEVNLLSLEHLDRRRAIEKELDALEASIKSIGPSVEELIGKIIRR